MRSWFFIIALLVMAASQVHSEDAEILSTMLSGKPFLSKVKPPGRVNVDANIVLRGIEEFDYIKHTFTVQVTFHLNWNDPRLSFTGKSQHKYITLSDPNLIWTPDVFFTNAFEGRVHKTLANNQLIRISLNGDIHFSSRITLKLACPLDVKYFPFDVQSCGLRFGSYGSNTENVLLSWTELQNDPIQVAKSATEIEEFQIIMKKASGCSSRTITGGYACLSADFTFSRYISQWLTLLYIPCCLTVLVSYLAFWVKNTNAKYFVAITALLVASALIWYLYVNKFPIVSYMMAVDGWAITCILFLITTLVLLVIFDNLSKDKPEGRSEEGVTNESLLARLQRTTSKVEMVARIIYPIAFIVYVIVYFLTYTLRNTSFDSE